MKEGFGLGVGVSMARHAVDWFFQSPKPLPAESKPSPIPVLAANPVNTVNTTKPAIDLKDYTQCIQEGGTEESCKQYIHEKYMVT
jgi:hypothetical protein